MQLLNHVGLFIVIRSQTDETDDMFHSLEQEGKSAHVLLSIRG